MAHLATFKPQRFQSAYTNRGVEYHECAICKSQEIASIAYQGPGVLTSWEQVLVLGEGPFYKLAVYCQEHLPEIDSGV